LVGHTPITIAQIRIVHKSPIINHHWPVPASEYKPQLATLVDTPPEGDEWLHEIKYDGYRIGARIRDGRVSLYSRTGKDWTAAFPTIADAARALGVRDALIDGEIAVVLPDGRTSFQSLQNRFADGESRVEGSLVFFAFDLLRHDGVRLDRLPLEERKARLKTILGKPKATSVFRFADHVVGNGHALFEHARKLGLEGIISKRRDLPYRPGRHGGWLKIKCVQRQEFVIGGFTDPEGARVGLGALLIGYYDNDVLVFAGRVGTGFTQKSAVELRARLDRLERKSCPFTPKPAGVLGRTAHWVAPSLVAEVAFTEWTGDGKIRHPSFQGLRADKKPKDVRRETSA
jgi:bifunctional non-homologous end joining protein LigD